MAETKRLLLIGGGGHAAVVSDVARAAGWSVMGCLDDDESIAPTVERIGLQRLGAIDDMEAIINEHDRDVAVHAAVGGNRLRAAWLERFMRLAPMPAIVHPSAIVSPSAVIEDGVFIGPRAVVNTRATVHAGAIINTASVVEHDCVIGRCAHIAPHATIAGGAGVGEGTLIGCAATMLPGVAIGSWSILAAGAVATENIPNSSTAIGVPARVRQGVTV